MHVITELLKYKKDILEESTAIAQQHVTGHRRDRQTGPLTEIRLYTER